MAAFTARWLEIAIDQYVALPEPARRQVDVRVSQLLEQPYGPSLAYDAPTDQWTTTYGGGPVLSCTQWSRSTSGCSSCAWCSHSGRVRVR